MIKKRTEGCDEPSGEDTTSPKLLLSFLLEKVFSFRVLHSSEVCWKCGASARVIRAVEFSGLRGMELHNVYRCVRNPQHTFKKRVKS